MGGAESLAKTLRTIPPKNGENNHLTPFLRKAMIAESVWTYLAGTFDKASGRPGESKPVSGRGACA